MSQKKRYSIKEPDLAYDGVVVAGHQSCDLGSLSSHTIRCKPGTDPVNQNLGVSIASLKLGYSIVDRRLSNMDMDILRVAGVDFSRDIQRGNRD